MTAFRRVGQFLTDDLSARKAFLVIENKSAYIQLKTWQFPGLVSGVGRQKQDSWNSSLECQSVRAALPTGVLRFQSCVTCYYAQTKTKVRIWSHGRQEQSETRLPLESHSPSDGTLMKHVSARALCIISQILQFLARDVCVTEK